MGIERWIFKPFTEGRPNVQFSSDARQQLGTFVEEASEDVGTGAFVGIGNGKIKGFHTSDIIPGEIVTARGVSTMVCHWRLDTAIEKAREAGQAAHIVLLGILKPSGERRINNGVPVTIINPSLNLTPGLIKYFRDFLDVTKETLGKTVEYIATAGYYKENRPFTQLYRAKHVCDPRVQTDRDINGLPRLLVPLAF